MDADAMETVVAIVVDRITTKDALKDATDAGLALKDVAKVAPKAIAVVAADAGAVVVAADALKARDRVPMADRVSVSTVSPSQATLTALSKTLP
jgi:acetyl esterase/lipase